MSVGYPDGQRVQNWDGPLAFSIINQRVPAVVASAALDVSRYAALAGQMWCSIGQAQITFQWYSDQGLGTTVGVRTINLDPNIQSAGQYLIPNMGPWLQVTVSGLAGSDPNVYLTVTPTNRQRTLELVGNFPVQVAQQGVALGASAQNTFTPLEYISGPIQVSCFAGQAYQVGFDYVDNLGNWTTFALKAGASGSIDLYSVLVPIGAWRVWLKNSSAQATTMSLRLAQSATGSS